jgi:ABC-type branched-subunit amino acid transport system substrate-binding protein
VTSPSCLSEERVAELVEGRLVGEELATAERHLADCAACRNLVTSMADAIGDVTAGTSTAPSRTEPPILKRNDRVGRYVILEAIGAGGMGRVYAAHDPALDRTIALKLLRSDVAIPDLESRLLREAKAMARVSHPHVIAVHDAGRHGDQVYIAMELVDGGTLRTWLTAAKRSWRAVLDVYLRAARGLVEAHAAGIVHRDFKPDNVLVGDDGAVVRVTDFGLARASHDAEPGEGSTDAPSDEDGSLDAPLTRTGALIGTPVYMAPEQHAGGVADARADVYSFCVALYEGLYGERPFVGTTLVELHAAKLAEQIRPAPRGSKVPLRLRRALLEGLRASADARYPSMQRAIDALTRAARTPRAPFAIAAGVVAIAAVSRAAGFGVARNAVVAAPALPECTTNRACVERHGGEPWMCRASDKTCVQIASDNCAPRFEPGDLEADDTVWLGAMFPTSGPIADVGRANANATDLARRELAHATRALTGTSASLRVRRVAIAECDDASPDGAARAARHLVDDVGVPAILGFRSGQEVMDLAGSLLVRRNVLAVATLTTSPLITQIPQPADLPRMVWRTTLSLDDTAGAIAGIAHDFLEPRHTTRGPTRIVLARGDAPGPVAFGQALLRKLVFNGKTAVQNGDDYQEIAVPQEPPDGGDEVTRIAARVAALAPTFVVLLVAPAHNVPLVTKIEERWKPGVARPTYLVSADGVDPFADFIGASAERRKRFFGVTSTSDSVANAQFVTRYNEGFKDSVSRTANPGSSYDAFFMLAFGAHAVGDQAITGPALARGFARLVPPGRAIDVGPTQVFEALSELARGANVDLDGTATSLDFNLSTGESPPDFALVCAAVDPDGRAKQESIESGVVYRAKTQRVDGVLRCP